VELLNHPPPLAGIGPVLDGSFGGKFTTSGIDEYALFAPSDFVWITF
jgi:hypothetical protein